LHRGAADARRTNARLSALAGAPLLFALALPVRAAERELEESTAPDSASAIASPIEQVFPEEQERKFLFPGLRRRLDSLPPFLRDSKVDVRFRTFYLFKDRTVDQISEAWAIGGSLAYQSGWLADSFAVEVEGFTSQPLVAPDDRGATGILLPDQGGYTVLGIANGKLRYKGAVLTGYRQYLDLPYANRNDSRMTPNTFEGVTLAKPEGEFVFSTGYAWKIKLRDSETFESFTGALGFEEDRGAAHLGAAWYPREDFSLGAVGAVVPDLTAGTYGELKLTHSLPYGLDGRLDAQFTVQREIGKDLLGDLLDDTFNIGLRASASRGGIVGRVAFSITGSGGGINALFGSNPSYLDLMQRTFNRADEKALLLSLSYDFARIGVKNLSSILNFAAAFGGKDLGERLGNAREIDLTLDYKVEEGPLKNFWLRVRGSWLDEESADMKGTDVRVILRYDFPVI